MHGIRVQLNHVCLIYGGHVLYDDRPSPINPMGGKKRVCASQAHDSFKYIPVIVSKYNATWKTAIARFKEAGHLPCTAPLGIYEENRSM